MPQKIFISYRRQDTAANALGIGQYLEHAFGRKSVFIDVDMRAGAKFPEVLERRLAECKVMLVLIGPEWLNSRDEQDRRRIESSDDWVRLEIAHALRRDITVIPVRVNGAELPARAALPEDIKGLLDHQAVSVTNAGFRHEMSGLVRDIRAIPGARAWWRFGAIAAVLLLFTTIMIMQAFGLLNLRERIGTVTSWTPDEPAQHNDSWRGSPGEWVMFALDQQPVAYYFKPSSVRTFGENVVYSARIPYKSINTASLEKTSTEGAYQDNTTVIECKKSIGALVERTVYNKSGEILSHYKWADPNALDMSNGEAINPSSVLKIAQHIFCDEHLRTSLSKQLANAKLLYLTNTPTGDQDIFYGPTEKSSDTAYPLETLYVTKFHEAQNFANLFSGVVGLPVSYRTMAEPLQLNCENRKVQVLKLEYFDLKNNLASLVAPLPNAIQPIDVKEGSPFSMVLNAVCGAPVSKEVGGRYEGINYATYKSGGQGEQVISILIEQQQSRLKVSFQAPGGEGTGTGTWSRGRWTL
jgi:hypothetical protein